MNEQRQCLIETELKRLNGNDLEGLLKSFNERIDAIFSGAIEDLEASKPRPIILGHQMNQTAMRVMTAR